MSDDAVFAGAVPEIYDRFMGPMFFEPFARNMAGRFQGWEGALLETAAGTGRLTRALAENVGPRAAITATDLNGPMLARAAQVVAAPGIRWLQADAADLPFPDGVFDAVVCQFGAMFFPDKPAAFAESRRVLRPGGRFVFSVWDRLDANDLSHAAHEAVLSLFPHNPPCFLLRTPFGYHDESRIRADLAQAGFGRAEVERVSLPTPARSAREVAMGLCMGTPLRAEIEGRRPEGVDAVVDHVARALAMRFGSAAIQGHGQALLVTAEAPFS